MDSQGRPSQNVTKIHQNLLSELTFFETKNRVENCGSKMRSKIDSISVSETKSILGPSWAHLGTVLGPRLDHLLSKKYKTWCVLISSCSEIIKANHVSIFLLFDFFEKMRCVETDDLVRKSSKSEPSSRFFGRLKIFAIFGSIGSIFSSTPSVMCQWVVLDRPAKVNVSSNFFRMSWKKSLRNNGNMI